MKSQLLLEEESLAVFSPAFTVSHPLIWQSGVVFSSPHSGSLYPKSFTERSSLSVAQLRKNEDIFIDKLFSTCDTQGAPLLAAQFPRCYVDVNRHEDEVPFDGQSSNSKVTARVQAGLGVVPTHINEAMEIYRRPLVKDIVSLRLSRLYHPYHNALQDLLSECVGRFGQALLIDCHSMPGFSSMGARRPDIILGDRFGKSCHPDTLSRVQGIFREAGYSVAVNYPYAGGFVTSHYGRPEIGVEALQIEINRDLYLNPITLAPKRGYQDLADNLERIISQIIHFKKPLSQAAQ